MSWLACATPTAEWRAAGHGCITMMVNVDATELSDPEFLLIATRHHLSDHGNR